MSCCTGNIRNECKLKGRELDNLRAAFEHRGAWFFFLLDEARKKGLNWDDFARNAIYRTGQFHGLNKFSKTDDLKKFAAEFANETVRDIFEMEISELTNDRFVVKFHYCPLVSAWMKQTENSDDIAHMCDIAMDGDRGIIAEFPDFDFDLQSTIASGNEFCRIVITKKKA